MFTSNLTQVTTAMVNTTDQAVIDNWPYEPLQPKQGLILVLITVPGVLGNIVAFAVTLKLLRTHAIAANYLVLALTITDFYGIFFCTLATHLCYIHKRWVGGTSMCNFQGFSAMFASLASGCLATALAIDRLFAITKPFKYRKLVNPKRAVITIVGIWVVSMAISFVPMGAAGRYKRNLTGTFCTIDWFATTASNMAYAAFYAILGITLLIIIIYCNVEVVLGLRRISRKRRTVLQGNTMTQEHVKEKKKSGASDNMERQFARAVCVISFLFFICWTPFMVRIVCNLAGLWKDPWADVQVSRLLILNFVLDPFLYSLSRKHCRDILIRWFCCCLVGKWGIVSAISGTKTKSSCTGRISHSSDHSKLNTSTGGTPIISSEIHTSKM